MKREPPRCPEPELLTIGHGRSDRAELAARLHDAGVQALVDVRRFPGSRHNPDVRSEALSAWLPTTGVTYRWDERLGGRRRLAPDTPSFDSWWREESFRAYAAYTRTTPFADAMTELVASAGDEFTVVMCSESVWWRCHRRLIADVAVLAFGLAVRHLMPNGDLIVHPVSDAARCSARGLLTWDRAAPRQVLPT